MKVLSLTEPWATLVISGAKKIETRSWGTSHRGEIGIHAAKTFPTSARECCGDPYYREALAAFGVHSWRDLLPRLGHMLGTARLVDCYQFTTSPPPYPERAFGDFTRGRYGFVLEGARPLAVPILTRGALGLWGWEPAVELVYADGMPVPPTRDDLFSQGAR